METSTNTTPGANTTTGQPQRGTDAAVRYQPAADSSPQHKAEAAKSGRLVLELGADGQACLCGCNQTAVSRFRPGHDATLRGKLVRAALHGAGLRLRFGEKSADVSPAQLAAKLDSDKHSWSAALETSVARARKAAAEAAKRRAAAAAEKAKRQAEQGQSSKLQLSDFAAA